jgi:hypothetical protein
MAGQAVSIYRKKAFWSLVVLLLIILSCVGYWYLYIRTTPVIVTLRDGQIDVEPASLRVSGPIQFLVENKGPQPHQFIVISIDKPADQLPVRRGEVQFFSEKTDPNDISTWTFVIYDGAQNGGFAQPGPSPNPKLGPPMSPGETRVVGYGKPMMEMGQSTLTILCNLPGHYEQGEFATLAINE